MKSKILNTILTKNAAASFYMRHFTFRYLLAWETIVSKCFWVTPKLSWSKQNDFVILDNMTNKNSIITVPYIMVIISQIVCNKEAFAVKKLTTVLCVGRCGCGCRWVCGLQKF